ncbi:MAG: PilZ domain-containing protein [Chthoniobacterales bacterium]
MQEDTSDKTRRRWQRFDVELRATLKLSRQGIEHQFSGTAHDISEGGTRLFVPGDLHPGEEIKLHLALPYSSAVELVGVIRNRDRFEYGVEFVGVSAEDRESLVRNCRALSVLE